MQGRDGAEMLVRTEAVGYTPDVGGMSWSGHFGNWHTEKFSAFKKNVKSVILAMGCALYTRMRNIPL